MLLLLLPLKKNLGSEALFEKNDLVAVGVKFAERYINIIGVIYYLVQQLTMQNINLWELSSTFTELIFYVEKKEAQLTFDTLYERFM